MGSLIIVVACFADAALAQPRLGDGHAGARTVSTSTQLNRYARLDADAAFASTELTVTGDLVRAGDLLLVVQLKADLPSPDGGEAPLDVRGTHLGAFTFARASSVAGNVVSLEAPLRDAFPAVDTQVVVVPEFTDLTITDSGIVTSPAWDGFTGGVVAFVAQGTVRNDGLVTASARGYRGGRSTTFQTPNPDGGACQGLDEPWPLGSMAGEGPTHSYPTKFGRGATVLGGGAGGCIGGGGAGGAFIGAGGRGGDSVDRANNTGLGSVGVRFDPQTQVLFGGGAGAGWSRSMHSGSTAPGASGGGLVFVRAARISGLGQWEANGGTNPIFGGGDWGYGGGGAAGEVWLESNGPLSCGAALATGGLGGRFSNGQGPGGGGSGGLVLLHSNADIDCPASAKGGTSTAAHGAEPTSSTDPRFSGTVAVLAMGQPVSSAFEPGVRSAPPVFLSTPNSTAFCGAPYRYGTGLLPKLSTPGPFVFSLEARDEPLPKGVTIDPLSGEMVWRPTREEVGDHHFTLTAQSLDGTATQDFVVTVECEGPRPSEVACSSAPWAGATWCATWVWRLTQRRRRALSTARAP